MQLNISMAMLISADFTANLAAPLGNAGCRPGWDSFILGIHNINVGYTMLIDVNSRLFGIVVTINHHVIVMNHHNRHNRDRSQTTSSVFGSGD